METFRLRTETQFKELLQFPNNHEFNCYLWKDISVDAAKEVVVMISGVVVVPVVGYIPTSASEIATYCL